MFQVDYDASGIAIGVFSSQEARPIAYFSKKFNDAKRKYYIYDQEFHAMVQELKKWRHYILPKEFFCILIIKLWNIWIAKEN